MRISIQQGNRFVPVDEKFNKHILFSSNELTADMTYTGVARWTAKGQTVTLYDVISDSITESAKAGRAFGPLTYRLVEDLAKGLNEASLFEKETKLRFELHVIGRHEKIPWPLIAVISTFRKQSPWQTESDIFDKEFVFPEISLLTTAAEHPMIVFGGMDGLVRGNERQPSAEEKKLRDLYNAFEDAAAINDANRGSSSASPQ